MSRAGCPPQLWDWVRRGKKEPELTLEKGWCIDDIPAILQATLGDSH